MTYKKKKYYRLSFAQCVSSSGGGIGRSNRFACVGVGVVFIVYFHLLLLPSEVGKEISIGKFPFKALGRSRASMDMDGFIKIITDKNTDQVLGVHILGPRAADMIMEAVTIMEFKGSAEDIARISHPHPTFSEGMKEAAMMAWTGQALHI